MKETKFIAQNKEKWSRFEELYSSNKDNPEELSNLYMDITEDLSYAQTFYKRRTVRVYLNQLAQRIFTGVHKQKSESIKKIFTVWQTSLPLEIYRSRKSLLFAFIAFSIYVLIGAITTHYNPDFPRIVLGDDYVNMTIQNIQKGNPLQVYEDTDQLSMFVRITTNNMKVAFLTFFVGFFFTIGTHILLFSNGVMLGAFQYFFHSKGLLITSFLGIWIHGAFEISAIVLAGGAGITAGNGWLFPKSYTRMQSLQLTTKRGLKIMMSLVPFIIAAGFLESYVTHNYQTLPEWSKWALIFLSFGLIAFYYFLYPIYVARKHPELVDDETVSPFRKAEKIEFSQIRDVGQIITATFQLYRQHFTRIFTFMLLFIFPLGLGVVFMQDYYHHSSLLVEHWYDWHIQIGIMFGFSFTQATDFIAIFLWSIVIAIYFCGIFWYIKPSAEKTKHGMLQFFKKRFFSVWLGNMILFCTVLLSPWYILLLAFFLLPFFLPIAATAVFDEARFGKRWMKGLKTGSSNYGSNLLILILILALTVVLSQTIANVLSIKYDIIDRPVMNDLLDLLSGFVQRIALIFTDNYMIYASITRQLVYGLFILLILPLLVIASALSYFSVKERLEAKGLRAEFEKFGKRKRYHETNFD